MWMMGLLLVAVDVVEVGSTTLCKAAMGKGMSKYVYIVYTHGIAFLFLIPAALLFHRKTPVPPIGVSIIFRIFLLSFISSALSVCLYVGIRYSSPTLAAAITNLVPAITFIMGIIFRMEKLNIRAKSSVLKIAGTLLSISGAFIVTFYQGLPITFPSPRTESSLLLGNDQPNWALGGLFIFGSCVCLSLLYVMKTSIARDFNSEVLITLISFFFEIIIVAIVTLIMEEDTSVWTPSPGIIWITILFGAFNVGFLNIIDTWACRKKGPLFVAMFKPLLMVIAATMGVSFLGDVLHLGSVIGGTIITVGFYIVMKGKAGEERFTQANESNLIYTLSSEEGISPSKVPLLHNRSLDL